jgi:hypothetical protein
VSGVRVWARAVDEKVEALAVKIGALGLAGLLGDAGLREHVGLAIAFAVA